MTPAETTPPPGRPLTARSVLASVLLGTDPPRLPVRVLVATTALFGIAEGTTRMALSRMAAAGELTAGDGSYALTGRLLERRRRQEASRTARTAPWAVGDDGRGPWRQAVVVAERRPADERRALRDRMVAARLAEQREGVWLRPDNLGPLPAVGDRSSAGEPDPGTEVCAWSTVVPDGDPAALAAGLWDLVGWHRDAEVLRAAMAPLVGPLEAGDHGVLADGFVLSAAVVRHLQRDPLLPVELLPPGWPGAALRADYARYDAAYRAVLATWFADQRSS